jgi:type I restriction enzyme S subunit
MSTTWPTTRLGDVLRKSDEIFDGNGVTEYREITVRLWGKGVVERRRVDGASLSGRRFVARQGQFIASRIDARNGAMGFVPASLDGALVTNDFPLFDVEAKRLLPRFLGWLCRTPGFVELCLRASEGTTNRVRLKEDRFLALEIPLPPLVEQHRIVARIEALAVRVAEARSLRLHAAEEAEAFVVSVHSNLAGGRARMLGEILRLDEEATRILPTGSYPQVGVKSFGAGLFTKGPVAGTETTYKRFNRLYFGAVLLSQVKGWEGAVAVCPKDLAGWYVSPEYRTFRCVPAEAHPGYLASLVRTEWFWGRLKDATRGVGARRERTRPEQFLAIRIPMPTVEQQARGELLFAKVDALKRLQGETAAELDALLPSVLDRAFKGEL